MKKDRELLIDEAYRYSKNIRIKALDLAKQSGKAGAHLGGSFSAVDIIATLYGSILNIDAADPDWIERDRFITSKRHCYLASYSALYYAGIINETELNSYHDNGGLLAGYPWIPTKGLDFSGGSLGMGLSVGIGMALTAKRKKLNYRTYVLLGDGECNEGAVWEGFMAAPQFNLNNLIVIIDYNKLQFDGTNDEIMSVSPLKEKLSAFGWKCLEVNGHKIEELFDAFNQIDESKPLAVVANTIKGYGLPSIENKAESHHAELTDSDYEYMMKEIQEGKYDRV